MPGLFPTLSNLLRKRTPQAQQQQNPMQYQQMPLIRSAIQMNSQPAQPGEVGNEQFNAQQKLMNRGRTRRGMGRM